MRTAYILHGHPDQDVYYTPHFDTPSNSHWIPWLQKQFLHAGILAQTLEMPHPYTPVYPDWAETFDHAHLKHDSIIVAHSLGCGFITKWLCENPDVRLDQLVLVAPSVDVFGKYGDFLAGFIPDPALADRVNTMHILYATNEPVQGVKESTEILHNAYPAAIRHTFNDKGHFCIGDLGGPAFEELWEICRPVKMEQGYAPALSP